MTGPSDETKDNKRKKLDQETYTIEKVPRNFPSGANEQTDQPPLLAAPTSGGDQTSFATFIKGAELRPFSKIGLSGGEKPKTYNNDLFLSSFRPIKYTWAGGKRKAALRHIQDSTSVPDHFRKAVDVDFFISKETPLAEEIRNSLKFITTADKMTAEDFRVSQLARVRQIVTDAEPLRKIWDLHRPTELRSNPCSLRTLALVRLMRNFDMGGGRWFRQFIHGFEITGAFEQKGVPPLMNPPPTYHALTGSGMTTLIGFVNGPAPRSPLTRRPFGRRPWARSRRAGPVALNLLTTKVPWRLPQLTRRSLPSGSGLSRWTYCAPAMT